MIPRTLLGKILLLAVLVVLLLNLPSRGQQIADKLFLDVPPDTVVVPFSTDQKTIQLLHTFLIPSSEKIFTGNFKWMPGIHYQMDYRLGQIRVLQFPIFHGSETRGQADTLKIIYQRYPFPLVPEYFHRKLDTLATEDSSADIKSGQQRIVTSSFFDNIETYQSNLQKSGSIVRGIEIGTNQDLTLNSGLNLQLSGYITPDVEIVAALTDQNTPIQPEGNTQTLQEVDKVFVKINSPYLGGTLGDFNLEYAGSQFGSFQRRLQGVTISNQFRNFYQQATYGTSRGTFHTVQFLGQEGRQGPYQLTGKNGEREIIVLAGTERVYVDGILQTRGENNDYIIDYGLAQITFTNKRLITSENRIEVDFQYAKAFQRYGKNLVGISSRGENLGRRLTYDVRFFREWDDTRNLLEDNAPLSEDEQEALRFAGDDPLKAALDGAEQVADGEGSYVKRDTTLLNQTYSYYLYVGPGNGNYQVRFTGVGSGKGSYRRERLGVYRFVGPGKGDYLPVRLIPLAGDKRLTDIGLQYRVTNSLRLGGEVAVSQFDQNIFSTIGDSDNVGNAGRFFMTLQDSSVQLLGKRLGELVVDGNYRWQGSTFSPLDRPFQPEYAYRWNLEQPYLTNQEQTYEVMARYRPYFWLSLNGQIGYLNKGTGISSLRQLGQVEWRWSFLPEMLYSYEAVRGKFSLQRSDWIRQKLVARKRIWKVEPRLSLREEDRRIHSGSHSLTGFYFQEGGLSLNLYQMGGLNWTGAATIRDDYWYDPQQTAHRIKQARSRTLEVGGEILPQETWVGRFSVAYRDKEFTPFFKTLPGDSLQKFLPDPQFQDTSRSDRQSHLANLEIQYRNRSQSLLAKWDYQVASELQALQEKVYLKVSENRGNYRYDEELGEYVPDPQGDYLLILIPSGDFESVTRIETAWTLQYRPRPAKSRNKIADWRDFWQQISSLTYVKISEQSRESDIWSLYLLNLDRFHSPGMTVRGNYTINQDLFFFERNPVWGLRLQTRYRDDLVNQFLDLNNNEARIFWERAILLRRQLWQNKVATTVEYRNVLNKRFVSSLPDRNRNILSHELETQLNLRPTYAWQIQLGLEAGWQRDRERRNQLLVRYLDWRPQVNYSIKGRARVSANLSALQVKILENPFDRIIPYEMGKGKKEGTSLLWNVRFEYFLSNNVTITANYTGRRDAGMGRTIHLGRAEVRAFF